jgi:methylenetetrahydrofolate reductase (NADPH)
MNIRVPAGDAWGTAVERCPKRMTHGPCAGVRADGACEAPAAGRCSYLDVPDRDWPYQDTRIPPPGGAAPGNVPGLPRHLPAAAGFLATAAARPVVIADLVAPPSSPGPPTRS